MRLKESLDRCVSVFTRYAPICVAFISSVLPTNHLFGHVDHDDLCELPS